MSSNWVDYLRLMMILASIVILALNLAVTGYLRRRCKEPGSKCPPYLWLLGASYLGLVFFDLLYTHSRMGEEFTWRVPLNGVILIMGVWGYLSMLGHVKKQRTLNNLI